MNWTGSQDSLMKMDHPAVTSREVIFNYPDRMILSYLNFSAVIASLTRNFPAPFRIFIIGIFKSSTTEAQTYIL
jgi:hypothetical protein